MPTLTQKNFRLTEADLAALDRIRASLQAEQPPGASPVSEIEAVRRAIHAFDHKPTRKPTARQSS